MVPFPPSFRRDVPESAASAARGPPTCTCRWRARAGPRRPGRSSVRATRTSIGASAQRRCAVRRHWGRACARSGRRSQPDRDSRTRKRCQIRGTARRMSAELRAVRAREGREKQRTHRTHVWQALQALGHCGIDLARVWVMGPIGAERENACVRKAQVR